MATPVRQCANCHQEFEAAELVPEFPGLFAGADTCFSCQPMLLFRMLSPEVQRELDEHIYAQHILVGMRAIRLDLRRQGHQVDFHVGNMLYSWRYRLLKELTPERLPKSDETYWDGFYS